MVLHNETAPGGTQERLQRNVQAGNLNNSEDTPNAHLAQASIEDIERYLEDIERCLESANECEKFLARRQYRLRRLILDLTCYRDHHEGLGRAIRGQAA